MRIRVTREFGGRLTSEQRIYRGEYGMDDPALFGVGQYLLDNGFAEPIDAPEVEETPVDVAAEVPVEISDVSGETNVSEPAPVPLVYAEWTNSELLAEIERRDIGLKEDGGSGSKGAYVKADYVHILEADDEAEG